MTTSDLPPPYSELNSWIRSRNRFLIIPHARPDGDAIGSAQGLAAALRAMGKHCYSYFHTDVPAQYRCFLDHDTTLYGDIDLSSYDNVIAVDCANAERLAVPNELELS